MWIVFSYIWLPFMILPVWAALERVPDSYLEASARPRRDAAGRRSAAVLLPLTLPGIVAGSIFTFSLTLGDYITPHAGRRRRARTSSATSSTSEVGISNNVPFAAAFATVPLVVMGDLPADRAPAGRLRGAVIGAGRRPRFALGLWAAVIMLFLFFPIVIIMPLRVQPLERAELAAGGLSTKWFSLDLAQPGSAGDALWLSLRAGRDRDHDRARARLAGGLRACHRYRFFGREAVSLLLVLPIALPGIITGMALNSFITFTGLSLRAADDRDRPRDLLHRDRLQQRARPPAPHPRPR